MIILQSTHISNLYVVHSKLIFYMSIISQFKKYNNQGKLNIARYSMILRHLFKCLGQQTFFIKGHIVKFIGFVGV